MHARIAKLVEQIKRDNPPGPTSRASRAAMVERLRGAHLPKPVTREDAAPAASASEARQRMVARIAGRTFSNAGRRQAYREDGVSIAPELAWYRALLAKSGYSQPLINEMLKV